MNHNTKVIHMKSRTMTGVYLTACNQIIASPSHRVAYSLADVTCKQCRGTDEFKSKAEENRS